MHEVTADVSVQFSGDCHCIIRPRVAIELFNPLILKTFLQGPTCKHIGLAIKFVHLVIPTENPTIITLDIA